MSFSFLLPGFGPSKKHQRPSPARPSPGPPGMLVRLLRKSQALEGRTGFSTQEVRRLSDTGACESLSEMCSSEQLCREPCHQEFSSRHKRWGRQRKEAEGHVDGDSYLFSSLCFSDVVRESIPH